VDAEKNVKKPIGMSGGRLEVTTFIVSGESASIQKLEKAVSMTGHKIEQMVIAPLASGIGVLTQAEMDLGAAVVDIGGSLTEIGVFKDGSLSSIGSFPVGSEHVTTDIAQLLKTTFDEAERLKVSHGSAIAAAVGENESVEVMQEGQDHARPMQRRVLCEIIESRMKEIARLTVEHLSKNGVETLPGGIVLTGGGVQLSHTERLFGEALSGFRIRSAEPELGGKFQREAGLATAAGLARYALQCQDEVMPATGQQSWRDRVKSIFGR
jgi:cell division protein FtsA